MHNECGNLTFRFDYGYLRLWGPIFNEKSSRKMLSCTIPTDTTIYGEQWSLQVHAFYS